MCGIRALESFIRDHWGYTQIRGALFNLWHDVARNTINANRKERGIEPAPERGRHAEWHTFIKSHVGASAGAHFFTAEVLLVSCLDQYQRERNHQVFRLALVSRGLRRLSRIGMGRSLQRCWSESRVGVAIRSNRVADVSNCARLSVVTDCGKRRP